MNDRVIVLDGQHLRPEDLAAYAVHGPNRGVRVRLDSAALERTEQARALAEDLSTRRIVYGRTTGVGANRADPVDPAESAEHGMRLLRSHAGGSGTPMPPEHVRAMLCVRLNQLAAGRSGVHPRVLQALASAVTHDVLPTVHRFGAIGTSDLTALAETGLAIAGERPWAVGSIPPVPIDTADALAFMSSNAATLGEAALACVQLSDLLAASHVIAALSYVALDGSPEAYATVVHLAKPHPGQQRCAAEMRRLLGMQRTPKPGRYVQDPYGLRAFPQVQGPALDALSQLRDVLTVELNASTENPMVSVADGAVYHNAHFHTAYVAVALDQARATVHHVAELSAARLGDLVEPDFTDLPAFLAAGPSGSSGVMILEYVAHDALAELRQVALPVTLGTAVVSRGLEDHASFSTQAARQATKAASAYRQVLACELVAAVRALRMRHADLLDLPVRAGYDVADAVLDPELTDRPLTEDIAAAASVLETLARI